MHYLAVRHRTMLNIISSSKAIRGSSTNKINTSMQINIYDPVGPYIDNLFDMLSACFRQVVLVLYRPT